MAHNYSDLFISPQGTWMCANYIMESPIILWNLLCSLTLKMLIALQLGGSIWYHLIWIGNSRNINKIVYPNLLPLTSERVVEAMLIWNCVFLTFCLEVSCWDIHFQYSAHVADQIVNTFSSLQKLHIWLFCCGCFEFLPDHKIWWSCFLKHAFLVHVVSTCPQGHKIRVFLDKLCRWWSRAAASDSRFRTGVSSS